MKKVLIITYYWPPSGKASLHWPLGLAKYFPEFGWEPVVLTVNEENFSHPDPSLIKEASSIRTIRTNTWEPFSLYKKFTGRAKDDQLVASETISKENKSFSHRLSIWIRMNLFIPDARTGWVYFAVKEGKLFLQREKVDAIISIGPPHTAHLIAKRLAKENNIPYYPVFIDPWTDIIYYKEFKRNFITRHIDSSLEESVLKNAEMPVFVTRSMRDDYLKKYSFLAGRNKVFYWGYNEENFSTALSSKKMDSHETILHAGNLFEYQDVPNFWKKVKREIVKGRNLKIKFIGTAAPGIKQSIINEGLQHHTEYAGFLPYNEALQEMINSDFLLVCASEKRHVPGKLFEYIRTGRPVIAFGDDNSEIADILELTGSGKLFSYSDDGREVLDNPQLFHASPDKARKFDRRHIAHEFSEVLNKFKK